MTPELLRRDDAVLLVIDIQEAFRDRIDDWDGVVARTRFLLDAAHVLAMPVMVTEQYPKGLGETAGELHDGLAGAERLVKLEFSSACAPGFDDALRRLGRQQVIVCGIEAHVCVHQTVLDLLAEDIGVQVARDATASRTDADRDTALHRLEQAGATLTSVEAALFELLGEAGTPEFKTVQELIR